MITFESPKHHWNYFLAIEEDLERLSRYIEFSEANMSTYSIELAHILLSASSEVDVIMKQLCAFLEPGKRVERIDSYREVIQNHLPTFIDEKIHINRFGLSYSPWENWNGARNPDWWRSYNSVKHQRNDHFKDASLQNAINAVGALLLTVVYYYKFVFTEEAGNDIGLRDTISQLSPKASLIAMNTGYYYSHLILQVD